jgi:dephospho-CoA kinase
VSLLIAVTGNIASGKSLVAGLFREKGCALVDADKVAHALYAASPALVREIGHAFGDGVLRADGTLDRARLGERVFGNPAALEALNRLVHPHLLTALREEIRSARKVMNRVVVDAALIVEWGIREEFDHLVLVTAPESLRLDRLMARTGLSREEAEARIRSQMPQDEKRPFADFVIENSGTEDELREKAEEVWERVNGEKDLGLRT